jgi:CheY-like chemotaxis protein
MMQPSSLLIVDADTRSLETLTFGFEREGCKVSSTPDPRRAVQLVRTVRPELAVLALRGPDQASLELIGGLRSAAIQDLPIVALGPATLKQEALAAGAGDFLPLPIFLRDVIGVGRLSTLESKLGHHGKEGGKKAPAAGDELQMRLSEFFGLFYLLRAMASSERSGVLQLTRGNRRAELRINAGAVVSATVGSLQGLPALHHVLLWEEAALSITRRAIAKRDQLHLSAQEVLDECERFLRDFAHAVRDLGAPRTLYVPAADPEAAIPGFQPSQVTPLLRLFDGHRVLSDVIEESPFRIFDTVRMIRRLRDGGALAARPDGLVREHAPEHGPAHPAHPASTAGARNGSQKSMLAEWAMVPDQRGVVGNRRSTSRRLRPIGGPTFGPPPPAAAAPTPIPLTTRKGSTTSGEIPAVKRRMTPARAVDLAVAPTVQVRLDPSGMPLSAPVAPAHRQGPGQRIDGALAGQKTPAPMQARGPSGKFSPLDSEPPPKAERRSGRFVSLDSQPAPKNERPSGRFVPLDSQPPPQVVGSGPAPLSMLDSEPPPRAGLLGNFVPLDADAPPKVIVEGGLPTPLTVLDSEPPPKVVIDGSLTAELAGNVTDQLAGNPPAELALDGGPPPMAEGGAAGAGGLPLALDSEPAPRIELTPRPRRITGGAAGIAPDAFDAIEADFFAREADLYKREALETFDDLDPVGGLPRPPGQRPRKK